MIRIDEIYNHVFWPWVKHHMPLTRMFFCDPPGRTDIDSVFNFGVDTLEFNYIFMYDQEPIHLDVHRPLFDHITKCNMDLDNNHGPRHSAIISSERDSEFVEWCERNYDWKSYYYFFNGWASLDWYRGYDRTFLMPLPKDRRIKHSFISPNRIIGGKRDHRLLLMYHLLRGNVQNALISFPRVCPAEHIAAQDLVTKFQTRYPDIVDTFVDADLPMNFSGEVNHPMHSCWLSLFDECSITLAHVVTETAFFGRRHYLTEKAFKPICQQMPFVMVGTAGTLEYLRSYGFQTFHDIWDESYDSEQDDFARLEKISELLQYLDGLDQKELQDLYDKSIPIVEHNYRHFYKGGFEEILSQEMQAMLTAIKKDFNYDV